MDAVPSDFKFTYEIASIFKRKEIGKNSVVSSG